MEDMSNRVSGEVEASLKKAAVKLANDLHDRFDVRARQIVMKQAKLHDVNLEAEAAEAGVSVDDYITSDDEYYETFIELSTIFLQEMNDNWMYPFLEI